MRRSMPPGSTLGAGVRVRYGTENEAYNGLSVYSDDPRGRGDVMHLIVAPVGRDLAAILVEPDSAASHAQQLQEMLSTKNP